LARIALQVIFPECANSHDEGCRMENWDEIRTAFQVARMGTVSGAAEVMGVHHATVIRHIDALEARLGAKLFQRHARGYTPTEAGHDLLNVAKATEEQFNQMTSRIKGRGETVSGELIVTAITGITDKLAPVLASFQQEYPEVIIRFLTDMRLFRLEYGEAHVAIRAGAAPQEPDNVARPFVTFKWALYASKSYIQRHGMPQGMAELVKHRFVGAEGIENRAPFNAWMNKHIPRDRVTFRITESEAQQRAVMAGLGIGFMRVCDAALDDNLVEVMPAQPEWDTPLWIVTHVDLHRTLKVQAFLAHLKKAAAEWHAE
jgi:DNA-binding transcriptional LysR family regulator